MGQRMLAVALCAAWLAGCGGEPATAPEERAEAHVTTSAADADYAASIEQWHAERVAKLREADGWFSFSGSGQVEPGEHTVGSAADNAIVLPKGPARLGVLRLGADGTLEFAAEPGSNARIDGQPFRTAALKTQLDESGPTAVHVGQTRFYVVKTGDRYGWRFRDPDSPALQAFTGIERFPVDPAWRVVAGWEAYDPPRTLDLVTTLGTIEPARVPGIARFTLDGRAFSLQPVLEEGDDTLFFILADRTSGKETYGGARFLYADLPRDGKVVLDFNKAQNPPCALNGHVVCPTAPPENRLDLAVTAGEKTYRKPDLPH